MNNGVRVTINGSILEALSNLRTTVTQNPDKSHDYHVDITADDVVVGRCARCKHWDSPLGSDINWPVSEGGKLPDPPWGECGLTALADHDQRTSKAIAADGNPEHLPVLLTSPDFGCVQWESKEP